MYGKIFDSIYDGTLVEDWRALITFQQMIVLCDADGTVDMTPHAISRRTGIPIEHIEAGLKVLENPDPYSRTPDQEGRRIELIDDHRSWGWVIINHEKYKTMQDSDTVREQTRERVRRHREKKRSVTLGNAPLRHTDTDTDTDTDTTNNSVLSPFDEFWSVYPRKEKKKGALTTWKRKNLDAKAEQIINDVQQRALRHGQWKEGFIPHATTYLNGERWNDDIVEARHGKTGNRTTGKLGRAVDAIKQRRAAVDPGRLRLGNAATDDRGGDVIDAGAVFRQLPRR